MIFAVDAHASGEPGRVIVGGVTDVPGATMFEKKTYLERHADGLRKRMLREPRGYPALCCNVILPPTNPAADAGFVIMEQTEYPPMSGTNTMCVATVLIELGMVTVTEPVTSLVLETPAGLIAVTAQVANGTATSITFANVPAFAVHLDQDLEVPDLGIVRVDVAYGGMFYVIAEADRFGLELKPDEGREIARVGAMLTAAAREQLPVVHPENRDIAGVSIAQLSGKPGLPNADRRNAVVVSTRQVDWNRPSTWTGALDRSPCGTGTCAKMAVLHARGELRLNQDFRHEGVLGTVFTGRLIEDTRVGEYRAVVPTITGRAWITGIAQYVLDADDPFPEGFTVADLLVTSCEPLAASGQLRDIIQGPSTNHGTITMSESQDLQSVVEGSDGISVIRGGGGVERGWNGIKYQAGMSAKNVNATKLSMNVATIPPGGVAYAHIHVDFEVMLYILEGRVRHEYGPNLEKSIENTAGDFIFIEPGVPHEVFNVSNTEPVVAVVARSDASEWENIVPYRRRRA